MLSISGRNLIPPFCLTTSNLIFLCFHFDALTELGAFMRTDFFFSYISVLRVASRRFLRVPTIYGLSRKIKKKKYQNFLPENFRFLVAKFSVYLNRRVFVMIYQQETKCHGKEEKSLLRSNFSSSPRHFQYI